MIRSFNSSRLDLPFNKARLHALVLSLVVVLCGLGVASQAQTVNYLTPIIITQGGTYTGNYQSLSSGVPCVRVATNAPVVLDGCLLSGAGNLIEAGEGANLTVRNCSGQGLAPTVNDQAPGRFLDAYRAQRLVIEHNAFASTSGIVVNRWSGTGLPGQILMVRYNRVRNIDGRWRNAGGSTHSSFLLLNTVLQVAGVEISYNEVVNTPDQSLVEDNINFYNSSGTAHSSIHVHDNFVRGAYPFPATANGFTGTGMTTDGDAGTLAEAAGYIEADHNQFVGTGNAAMNLAAGHDIYYHDNRAVTSGTLPDGRRFNAGYAALGVFNYYHQPASVYFNNRVENNTVGYVRWGANDPYQDRQDLSPGACGPCTGTVHLPNPITPATEDAEWAVWQMKLKQAAVAVGPSDGTMTPVPTSTPPSATTGMVANAGFEADGAPVGAPAGWQTQAGAGSSDNADYTEAYGGAHTGAYHGTHYRPENYEVATYQLVTGLPAGTYAFSAWVKSSGGQLQAQLRAWGYGGPPLAAAVAATNGDWVLLTLPNIALSNGQCQIGFYSLAYGGQWLYFDDVALVKQPNAAPNAAPTVSLITSATTLVLGQAVSLTATAADADGTVAKVEFFNGTVKLGEATAAPYQLSWTPLVAGSYKLTATATNDAGTSTVSAKVTVAVASPVTPPVAAAPGVNLVANPGFEADGAATGTPAGWQKALGPGTNDYASYTEAYGGAHAGAYHGTHYSPAAYETYTYQVVTGLAAGTYTFSAWVKSSGGQAAAQLRASNYGGPTVAADVAAIPDWKWTLVSVPDIAVGNGQCEIGFYSQAGAGQWLYFDDVMLALKPLAGAARSATLAGSATAATAPVLYPNPANDRATVFVTVDHLTTIELTIANLQGTTVASHKWPAETGTNQFTFSTAALPAGIYVLRLSSGTIFPAQRLEVRH